MSRYLLGRICEAYNLTVSFEPKLFADWSGSGCHTNYSTKTMRAGTGGMKYIEDMMVLFEKNHDLHMKLYGERNKYRMTGAHETASFSKFTYGAGNRAASFRIPTQVFANDGAGYIEDRRPGSNIDPYVVGSVILATSVLNGNGMDLSHPMVEHFEKWEKFIA